MTNSGLLLGLCSSIIAARASLLKIILPRSLRHFDLSYCTFRSRLGLDPKSCNYVTNKRVPSHRRHPTLSAAGRFPLQHAEPVTMADISSHSCKRANDQESPRGPPAKRSCVEFATASQPASISQHDFQSRIAQFPVRYLLHRPLMRVLDYLCSARRFNITNILEYDIVSSASKIDGSSRFPADSPLNQLNVLHVRRSRDSQTGKRQETMSEMKKRLRLPEDLLATFKTSTKETDLLRSPNWWIIVLGLYQKYLRAKATSTRDRKPSTVSKGEEEIFEERDEEGGTSDIDNALFTGDEDNEEDDEDLPESFDDPQDVFHSILSDLLERRRVRELQMTRRESIAEWMERLDVPDHMRRVEHIQDNQVEGLRSQEGCQRILDWHERAKGDVVRRRKATARVIESRRHVEPRSKLLRPANSAPLLHRPLKTPLSTLPSVSTSASTAVGLVQLRAETSNSDLEELDDMPQPDTAPPSTSPALQPMHSRKFCHSADLASIVPRPPVVMKGLAAQSLMAGGSGSSAPIHATMAAITDVNSPRHAEAQEIFLNMLDNVTQDAQCQSQKRIQELEAELEEYRLRSEAALQESQLQNKRLELALRESRLQVKELECERKENEKASEEKINAIYERIQVFAKDFPSGPQ